jgi:hypothetical protein
VIELPARKATEVKSGSKMDRAWACRPRHHQMGALEGIVLHLGWWGDVQPSDGGWEHSLALDGKVLKLRITLDVNKGQDGGTQSVLRKDSLGNLPPESRRRTDKHLCCVD